MHKCKFRLSTTIFSNQAIFICILAIVGPIVVNSMPLTVLPNNNNGSFLSVIGDFLLQGDTKNIGRNANELLKNFPNLQLVVSRGLQDCLWRDGLLRCLKIYFLQKMEQNKSTPRSNFEQHSTKKEKDQSDDFNSNEYLHLSGQELNTRLMKNIRSFLSSQTVQMHLLPHMLLRIVSSKENKLQFSVTNNNGNNNEGRSTKDNEIDEEKFENVIEPGTTPIATLKKTGNSGGGIIQKQKNKKSSYKHTILQMAVPIMVMPAILMSSLLPFVLPVLKMATIMTILMNNSAFLAALLYAARTHANVQEEQHISFGHSAYQ